MGTSHHSTHMTYQLVIFDCDGVLVDSEPLAHRVLLEALGELGLPLSMDEALAAFKGASMHSCIAEIEKRLGRKVPDVFVPALRERTAEAFRRELRPVEGIHEVLDRIPLSRCVASSGPPEKIRLSLSLANLLPYFEGRIFSAYEIRCWKPDPGLFLHAARSMGVPPEACAVVEDSLLGVQSGIAAGMRVFGYAAEGDGQELKTAGALLFHRMSELPSLLEL